MSTWTGGSTRPAPNSASTGQAWTSGLILDLARDVAHRVDRPAAPVTAFLLGVAVGSGQPVGQAADRLSALAASWQDAP